jgi:hypothetical protein
VDAPGKIENKIVCISVILRGKGNVITVFYTFFQNEMNAENSKLLPWTLVRQKIF